jgi:hypothetical protein
MIHQRERLNGMSKGMDESPLSTGRQFTTEGIIEGKFDKKNINKVRIC